MLYFDGLLWDWTVLTAARQAEAYILNEQTQNSQIAEDYWQCGTISNSSYTLHICVLVYLHFISKIFPKS